MLETGINVIEWPSRQHGTISAFGGDALQRQTISHKSSFVLIDEAIDGQKTIWRHYIIDRLKVKVTQPT